MRHQRATRSRGLVVLTLVTAGVISCSCLAFGETARPARAEFAMASTPADRVALYEAVVNAQVEVEQLLREVRLLSYIGVAAPSEDRADHVHRILQVLGSVPQGDSVKDAFTSRASSQTGYVLGAGGALDRLDRAVAMYTVMAEEHVDELADHFDARCPDQYDPRVCSDGFGVGLAQGIIDTLSTWTAGRITPLAELALTATNRLDLEADLPAQEAAFRSIYAYSVLLVGYWPCADATVASGDSLPSVVRDLGVILQLLDEALQASMAVRDIVVDPSGA